MKRVLVTVVFVTLLATASAAPQWKHFRGMCDASAVEMLTPDLFVAANDEDNVLRVYSRSAQGGPRQALDFSSFFRLPKRVQEIDLEGSARLGDRIYWISSHGANAKGKAQPSRHRFFATQVVTNGGVVAIQPVGRLWANLVNDMTRDPALASLGLAAAARKAPKDPGALNIEGLAATADGRLLIGFRNPVPAGKALILPLLNPQEVTTGRAARFGKPVFLELNGLGIRSITSEGNGYLIVGGSFDGEGASRLFRWDGKSPAPQSVMARGLAGNPEGLAVLETEGARTLFVLSDDGTRKINGRDCKKLKDPALKVFRGYELPLDP